MRKSFFWLILFLFVAGCRLLPTKTITPTPFQTEEPLNTPGTPEIPTAERHSRQYTPEWRPRRPCSGPGAFPLRSAWLPR